MGSADLFRTRTYPFLARAACLECRGGSSGLIGSPRRWWHAVLGGASLRRQHDSRSTNPLMSVAVTVSASVFVLTVSIHSLLAISIDISFIVVLVSVSILAVV